MALQGLYDRFVSIWAVVIVLSAWSEFGKSFLRVILYSELGDFCSSACV